MADLTERIKYIIGDLVVEREALRQQLDELNQKLVDQNDEKQEAETASEKQS